MTAYDARIAAALDELQPLVAVRYEWERVLAEARRPPLETPPRRGLGRPKRALLPLLLVVVAISAPVLAVGASRGWWFQSARQPKWWASLPRPVQGAPVIVATGRAHGQSWTGVAFIAKNDRPGGPGARRGNDICLALIVGSRSTLPQSTGCGLVKPPPRARRRGWPLLVLSNWSTPQPPVVAGAVAADVARVEVVLNPNPYPNGRQQTLTPALDTSSLASAGVRLFVVTYPADVGIDHIDLFDANGRLLRRQRFG